jgi:hydroxymethylpyrimidine kinase/phosphomethylpyrimidine kinase/thiamine-phosphate diphosphorylase
MSAGLRLGIRTLNIHQALSALKMVPSYIALANILPPVTPSQSLPCQGISQLALQTQLFNHRCPLVAVGGLSLGDIAAVKATKVGGVALLHSTLDPENYQQLIFDLLEQLGYGDPIIGMSNNGQRLVES